MADEVEKSDAARLERASESVIATGEHAPIEVGPVSSSPILVSAVGVTETSRNVASIVPSLAPPAMARAEHERALAIGRERGELPLRTVVLLGAGVVVLCILGALLLFR